MYFLNQVCIVCIILQPDNCNFELTDIKNNLCKTVWLNVVSVHHVINHLDFN